MIATRKFPATSLWSYGSFAGLFALLISISLILLGTAYPSGFAYQTGTPAASPYTGFRGTIHMRFKLVITTTGDKTPSEDWRLYLWNDLASESSRWELYRTCKDQPIAPHDANSLAALGKVGARAIFGGPMFERCLTPWMIEVRIGDKTDVIDLRDGSPLYRTGDSISTFSIGGFSVGTPGYPAGMRSIPDDPDYTELLAELREMRYEDIRQTGAEIVAGRKTIMFEMTSPPSKTPTPTGAVEEQRRTIWVDPETHIIMGSESLDKDGVSILSWAFTEFELNPQLAPDLFTITDPNKQTPTTTP